MTDIEALEWSIKLWNWLVDNPGKEKRESPFLEPLGWVGRCSLCEHVKEKHSRIWLISCKNCLMYDRWPTPHGNTETCTRDGAYVSWTRHTAYRELNYDTSFFALILVEAFEERLKELK